MIDVIITTYNRLELLQKTIDSFLENTDFATIQKIVITNDGSTDGTTEYLTTLSNRIKNIEIIGNSKENKGIIHRFNEAFLSTNAEYVCEFQDDVTFTKNWLQKELECLNKYDVSFVSGFDAPEHHVHKLQDSYKIKPSTRFTQLLAKRTVWAKWFPMKPRHKFATPTKRGGRSIGSEIDCTIYKHKKNNWSSQVKFLIIPGLVDHLAEKKNSTWR